MTSIAPDDYSEVDETLIFTAGQMYNSVQVSIMNDALVEPAETLTIEIFINAPFNDLASVGTPNQANITIVDNNGVHILVCMRIYL